MGLKTPLYRIHRELGARFTEFAGYEMPLQFSTIKEEHIAVRTNVGLFDVSHMGNIWIRGKDAEKLISL
ncbi:MAG: glycine cleavage system aminomethyltransferase GcvT, partial [Thermoplasmata archaeon]